MTTKTTPQPSIRIFCPHCQQQSTQESGGSYTRKNRDLNGIRIIRIQRYRCSQCHQALPSAYPAGVHRNKWYSEIIQTLFLILNVHQVNQSCQNEIAQVLGYPIVPDTRDDWSDTRALRAEKQHQNELLQLSNTKFQIKCGSLDEFKLGFRWVYTLTDTMTQAVMVFKTSASRTEASVQEVIKVYPPKTMISDGCPKILSGASWWADIPHGRCWFHVMQSISKIALKEKGIDGLSERQQVIKGVQSLIAKPSLKEAEAYLKVFRKAHRLVVLEPLIKAWKQLRLYWELGLPLTNNTSETLYNAVWARTRKRVVKASDRGLAWLSEAFWRWNHHLVRGQSPWERLTGRKSEDWTRALVIPLGRSRGSTHF